MSNAIKLTDLPVGHSARIQVIPTQGTTFLRLREMGLLVGTSVSLIRTAPLGDPIEIKVRGYNLSLRKSEADHILVEPAPTS